jgi:hypothetical protein
VIERVRRAANLVSGASAVFDRLIETAAIILFQLRSCAFALRCGTAVHESFFRFGDVLM